MRSSLKKNTTSDRSRVLHAEIFKAQSLGDGYIQEHVKDILRLVEDDIKSSIEESRTSSQTELAVLFDIPGMDRGRARKHIYFHILRSLKKAGYIPSLEIKGKSVFLNVTWLSKEDDGHEKYMTSFIKSHIVKKKVEKIAEKPISRRRRGKKKSE
jgi:hypothetical protein